MALITTTLALGAGGCIDVGAVRDARDRAHALSERLDTRARDLDAMLSDLDPGSAAHAEASAQLGETLAMRDAVQVAVSRADAVLREAESPTEPISQAVGFVAPWVPEPARAPLVLGGALLATAARARQLRQAAASIARGIERAMEDDPGFAQQFQSHAPTMRSIQTHAAARIVDQVQTRARRRPASPQQAGATP